MSTLVRPLPDRFETARLVLRPIAMADAPAICATYAQDSDVTRYMTWKPHHSMSETESYVAACLAAPPDQKRTFLITDRGDAALLGAFDLRREAPHRFGFGYLLARAAWGRGCMTEALRHIVDWALNQPEVWRMSDVCDVENLASARVMEKAGFVREGVLHRWAIHPNLGPAPRDCFLYAKVK